ncbi:MAG: hypothetical protein K8T91_08500 [Planctomycetes bacterium]|nr:hypothetical protein [Planctomycetota bacterium]
MTFVDAISLIQNKPATQLTWQELEALRAFVENNPSFYAVAGGREAVERYLAEGVAARAAGSPASSVISAAPIVELAYPAEPLPPAGSARRRWILAAEVLLVFGVAAGLWWYFDGQERLMPAPAKNPTVAKQEKKQTDQQEPQDKEREKAPEKKSEPTPPPFPPEKKPEAKAPEKSAVDAELATKLWEGWLLKHAASVRTDNQFRWDLTDPANPRPQKLLSVSGGKIELSADLTIGEKNWLRIALAELSPNSQGQIEVSADGRPIARFPISKADSFAIPLEALRGKKVRLSIAYLPGKPEESVVWDSVQLVTHRSGVAWIPLKPQRMESAGGAKLSARADDSIVVEGNSTEADEYLVIATLPNINIRAVKLEALGDPSLPSGGPGRASNGAFCLAQFGASLTEQDEQHDKVTGRYVRVELPGPDRPLMMAEVEVFADGKNVAMGKPTAQSSAERRSFGERAVDGNRQGAYDHYRPTTVMHTRAGLPDAWWEVDLGREYPIERIAIWNRTDRLSEVMANHRVVVLDMYRKVAWQQINPYAPMPSMVYGPFVTSKMPLEFRTAAIRTRNMLFDQPRIVRAVSDTAANVFGINEASNILFPLDRSDDALGKANFAGRQVSFRIRHRDGAVQGGQEAAKVTGHQNLGRFRLLVTADPVGTSPEPPVEVVALLPDAPKVAETTAPKLPETKPVPPGAPPTAPAEKRSPNELIKNFAWEGWLVNQQAGTLATPRYLWDVRFTESPQLESRFSTSASASTPLPSRKGPGEGSSATVLSQAKQIDASGAWLKLRAGQATPTWPIGQVEVRVEGKAIAKFEATPIEIAPERLISLQEFVGRNVKIELVHIPGSDAEVIEWDSFGFVPNPEAAGYVDWQPLTPLAAFGRLNATYKILPDNSVLTSGDIPPGDVSTVTAKMPPQKITAVRLEVMPDPSLPMGGPGHGDRGGWNLGKFTAEVIDENRPKQTHTGRFVRFELVGKGRAYHLAEVQVFAGGKNVALNKPARQCSETAPGIAARAVDGVPDDQGHGGAAGFAYPGPCDDNWWEVDLQQDFPIERITLWNRQWDGRPMANHKITILDKDRKEVWSFTNPDFPIPCETYEFPYAPQRPRFTAADVTFDFRGASAPDMLKLVYPTEQDGVPSWHSGDNPGRMQVAVFTLDPNENLSGKLVAFQMGQFRPLYYNLGRFRLAVTTAPGPHKARRPIVIVPKAP